MGRPRQLPGVEDTRDRVLRAATEAFARDGFARATLADIGRAAGISRPSLLHHFPTKDALYAEVVGQVFGALGEALARSGRGGSFVERLRSLCHAYDDFLSAHPSHARLVARELLDGEGPGAPLLRDRALPLLELVTAEVAAGPVRSVSVRHAILMVAADGLLAAAARGDGGPDTLGALLWGPADRDRTWRLASALLLRLELREDL